MDKITNWKKKWNIEREELVGHWLFLPDRKLSQIIQSLTMQQILFTLFWRLFFLNLFFQLRIVYKLFPTLYLTEICIFRVGNQKGNACWWLYNWKCLNTFWCIATKTAMFILLMKFVWLKIVQRYNSIKWCE